MAGRCAGYSTRRQCAACARDLLVVSPEVTAARLRRLDRCVKRLRQFAAMPLETCLADEDAQALAERYFRREAGGAENGRSVNHDKPTTGL